MAGYMAGFNPAIQPGHDGMFALSQLPIITGGERHAAIAGDDVARLAPAIDDAIGGIMEHLGPTRRIAQIVDAARGIACMHFSPQRMEWLEHAIGRGEHETVAARNAQEIA